MTNTLSIYIVLHVLASSLSFLWQFIFANNIVTMMNKDFLWFKKKDLHLKNHPNSCCYNICIVLELTTNYAFMQIVLSALAHTYRTIIKDLALIYINGKVGIF